MEPNPVIEYSGPAPAPRRRRPGWLAMLLMLLTGVACLYFWFGAMDTWSFARKSKQYGQNLAILPQIESDARAWIIQASVVSIVAAVGWSIYFMRRRAAR
jgi:hypothetical protein